MMIQSQQKHPSDGKGQRRPFRAVSVLAIVSLLFGALSVVTLIDWPLAIVPAIGILLGVLALRRIRRAPDVVVGRVFALLGLWLSVTFWAVGYGRLTMAYRNEFPHGYERVSYDMLQPDPKVRGQRIPPAIIMYQGKRVGMVGYMRPTRQQTRIKRFILCPSISNCPFCTRDPKPTEMVVVEFRGDLDANYTVQEIKVGGRFSVDENSPTGVPYLLEADYLR